MENDQPKTGPTMKRGKSKQDYQTPIDLMEAVRRRFGVLAFDLAASQFNTQCPLFFDETQNSLVQPWHKLNGWLWLNPPFANIEIWASKCQAEMVLGAKILFLTPASVGSNWYEQWVRPVAHSLFLNPRVQFVGAEDPYPKDIMISVFAHSLPGNSIWKWK